MSTQPLLVVHVFQAMDAGGAETRTLEVLRHVDPALVRTVIVTLAGRKGELAAHFEALGVEIVPMPLDLGFPRAFLRFLQERRPNCVHSHVATFSAVPLLIARAAGVPCRIAQFRSTGDRHGNSPRRRLQRALMRSGIDRSATAILGVSPGALTHGWRAEWPQDPRCAVVPTGVELAATVERDRPYGPPVVAHIGRSLPEKNRARAVSVFASFLKEYDRKARLLMLGRMEAQEEEQLLAIASRHGVAHAITLLGHQTDVRDVLARSDVLLVTSTREGLPGVVLEGLSVGTPCLSSDLPGSRYIAESLIGISVLSLSACDRRWAEELDRLCTDRSTQARAVRRARFEASSFTATAVARRVVALWETGKVTP